MIARLFASCQCVPVPEASTCSKEEWLQNGSDDTLQPAKPLPVETAPLSTAEQDVAPLSADAALEASLEVPAAPRQPLPGEESRICPMSGIAGLEGVCPFAKPKNKAKNKKPPKLKMATDFLFDDGSKKVTLTCRPHMTEHWATLETPDTSTTEQIKKAYKKMAIKHHPDKNLNDPEAVDRFQKVKDAYQDLQWVETGELGFPWDENPEIQEIMTGEQAMKAFGGLAEEACSTDPIKAQALRHMAKCATEVKLLMWEKDEAGIRECWCSALCLDDKSGATHIVKAYRRETS